MRFLSDRVNEDDVRDTLALMMIVGLGSARSLERGKFRIEQAEIDLGEKQPPRKDRLRIPDVKEVPSTLRD